MNMRSFRTAAWLGWKIESNWTDPFLFTVYSIVKPLAGAAILVVMYSIITNGAFTNPLFPYIYLGNAFYMYVGAVMTGVSWAVIDDREHYRTLKYMYVAPIRMPLYLVGRAVARFVTGSFSVIITIAFGALFLHVPIVLAEVDWLLFAVSLMLGVILLALMGLILAAITLLLARHGDYLGDTVAGGLYLFSGAVFPLDVLPAWLRPVGFALPFTYWLELLRRSLVGSVAQAFPTLSTWSNNQLLGVLVGSIAVSAVLAVVVWRYCDYQARERGYIDRTTNY